MAENYPLICRLCTSNRQCFKDYRQFRCHLRVDHNRRDLPYEDTLLYEKWPGSLNTVLNLPDDFVIQGKRYSNAVVPKSRAQTRFSLEEVQGMIRNAVLSGVREGIATMVSKDGPSSFRLASSGVQTSAIENAEESDDSLSEMPRLIPATAETVRLQQERLALFRKEQSAAKKNESDSEIASTNQSIDSLPTGGNSGVQSSNVCAESNAPNDNQELVQNVSGQGPSVNAENTEIPDQNTSESIVTRVAMSDNAPLNALNIEEEKLVMETNNENVNESIIVEEKAKTSSDVLAQDEKLFSVAGEAEQEANNENNNPEGELAINNVMLCAECTAKIASVVAGFKPNVCLD